MLSALEFFQHECSLEVRVPHLKAPNGSIRLVEPDWAGRLEGFTLMFETPVLTLAREIHFATVARLMGEGWCRLVAICKRHVDLASGRG